MGTHRKSTGAAAKLWIQFLAISLLFCVISQGQTQVDLSTQGKNVDFSNAAATRPIKVGATLPSTCQQGEAFYSTAAPQGSNLYLCGNTNNWVTQVGNGNAQTLQSRAVSVALPSNAQVLTWMAGSASWQPATVPTAGATDPVTISVSSNRITLASGAKAQLGAKETTLAGTCAVDTTGGTGSVWFYLAATGEWTAGTNVTATLVSGSSCQLTTSVSGYPPSSIPLGRVAVATGVPGAIEIHPQVIRNALPIIAGANCAVSYTTQGAAQISCSPGTNGLADPLANGIVVRNAANATVSRTLGGTSGRITVTNGDGVSGNPSIDLSNSGVTAGTYNNATLTVDAFGRLTAASSGSVSLVSRSTWTSLPVCNTSQSNALVMLTDTAGVQAHCDGSSYVYFGPHGVIRPPALQGALTALNSASVTDAGGNRYLTGSGGADPNLRAAVTALPGSWQGVEIGFQMLNLDSSSSHACGLVLSETAAASSKAALIGLSNAARHTVLSYTTFTSGVTAVQAVMPFTNLLAVQNSTTTQFYRIEKNGANFDMSISSDRSMWRKFATGVALGFTPGFFGMGCDPRGTSGQPGIMANHLEVF